LQEPLLVHHLAVDLFTDPDGEKIAADRKAITYRIHYRSQDKTLKTKEVDEAHQAVLEQLKSKLPIEFR
jgi:phenylalanyl-tRNA synthetase beta chain